MAQSGRAAADIFRDLTRRLRLKTITVGTLVAIAGIGGWALIHKVLPASLGSTAFALSLVIEVVVVTGLVWPFAADSVKHVRVNDRLRSLAGLPASWKGSALHLWGPAAALLTAALTVWVSESPSSVNVWPVPAATVALLVFLIVGRIHSSEAESAVKRMIEDDHACVLVEPLRLVQTQVAPRRPETVVGAVTRLLGKEVL